MECGQSHRLCRRTKVKIEQDVAKTLPLRSVFDCAVDKAKQVFGFRWESAEHPNTYIIIKFRE